MKDEILKNLKHNIIVNLLDGGFFGLAIGFASFSTILPLFVSTMTDSAILIGLIPAIHTAFWQLPQLFTARLVARQRRVKPLVLALTTQERLAFLGLAFVAWFLPQLGKQLALVLTFALITWQSLGAGFTANGWQSLIAKIIPPERRGTFFGAQAAVANLLASVSAILAGQILEKLPTPNDYALCFLLCFIGMVFSWYFLALTRESESASVNTLAQKTSFWNDLGIILKKDANFRWFLIGRMFSMLGTMGFAFYSVYAVRNLGVSEAEVGVMTGLLLAIQILANPLMGWLGDRWSRRLLSAIGMLAAALGALVAWWASTPQWFYLVVSLTGIATVAIWTIGLTIVLDFGIESERSSYIGLANTLVAPAAILAPFLGGWLADMRGYPATFLATAAAGLASAGVFYFLVVDPQKTL